MPKEIGGITVQIETTWVMAAVACLAVAAAIVIGSRMQRSRTPASVPPGTLGLLGGHIPYPCDLAKAGTLVTGMTGSGKTTSVYFDLIEMHGRNGHGGVILVPKVGDAEPILKVLEHAGALNRAVVVRAGRGICVNPLEWISKRASRGGSVDFQIVRLILQLAEVLNRSSGGSREDDAYFRALTERTLFFASACCRQAYGTVTAPALLKLMASLPNSQEQARTESYHKSFAHQTLLLAIKNSVLEYDRQVIADAMTFIADEWATLAEKPRSCVLTTATGVLHKLVYGVAREVISGPSTVDFESILRGAIFIIDISPKEFFDEAVLVQAAIKQFCQMVVEASGGRGGIPVLLAIDEYPMVALEADAAVMATSRSAGLCWVITAQTLPNLYATFGGGDQAKQLVDSMVGNICTVIACQSSCPVTNDWYCERIGKRPRYFVNTSNTSRAYEDYSPWGPGPAETQVSLNEQYDFLLPPFRLTQLRRGGPPGFVVEAIVTMSGRPIGPAGEPFCLLNFNQWVFA